MFIRRLSFALLPKHQVRKIRHIPYRGIQVSVVGAGNEVGSNLATLIKQSKKIKRLQLYDDDPKVRGIALELNLLPGGPLVTAFTGHDDLGNSISDSDLIVMVSRSSRKVGNVRDEMLVANAPAVHRLCLAVLERNPAALLAIATNPINCLIPLASAILFKNYAYNPFKLLGITHIDTARCRSHAATVLNANPKHLSIPVVGGHSEQTIVPLFSNIKPTFYNIDASNADILTAIVKKAGAEIINQKNGVSAANLAMAWSINEFVEGITKALTGHEVELYCFTANPHFGTRFFAGPNIIGPYGLSRTCCNFDINYLECIHLTNALHALNKDIDKGEKYADIFLK